VNAKVVVVAPDIQVLLLVKLLINVLVLAMEDPGNNVFAPIYPLEMIDILL
jgi:hypothetical protein